MLKRAAIIFIVIFGASTILVAGTLLVPGLAFLATPTIWPFFIVFGFDETTEAYGRYGELLRAWACAVPTSACYAYLLARRRLRVAPTSV
jgi:hypothetical protein